MIRWALTIAVPLAMVAAGFAGVLYVFDHLRFTAEDLAYDPMAGSGEVFGLFLGFVVWAAVAAAVGWGLSKWAEVPR